MFQLQQRQQVTTLKLQSGGRKKLVTWTVFGEGLCWIIIFLNRLKQLAILFKKRFYHLREYLAPEVTPGGPHKKIATNIVKVFIRS